MDVEFYRKELKGEDRALLAVCSWLKGVFGEYVIPYARVISQDNAERSTVTYYPGTVHKRKPALGRLPDGRLSFYTRN